MAEDNSFTEETIAHLTLVDSPKLTKELLSKPPYRFIFDIVRTIQKKTGFGEGLFTDDELESGKPIVSSLFLVALSSKLTFYFFLHFSLFSQKGNDPHQPIGTEKYLS